MPDVLYRTIVALVLPDVGIDVPSGVVNIIVVTVPSLTGCKKRPDHVLAVADNVDSTPPTIPAG